MKPDNNPSIARIDAYRARRVGEMLVTREAEESFQSDPNDVLVDLEALDGRELVSQNAGFEARYATAPFDPEGRMLRFYPGGVTIWSGFPGAGKTTLLRQFICHTLHRGSSVFLASLEEDPRRVIFKLAATAAGTRDPSAHQVQWFIDAYAKRFRLWGVIGIAQHLRLLALARQLAAENIRHVIFDSLMCLDVANDSTEGQRRFANLLATTARAAGVHIHLVAHPRKPQKAGQEIDLNDVAGAREIGGVADNVIFIRRDPDRNSYAQNADVTPMCVSIKKQRHFNGALGDCEGWFHRPYWQYSKDQFLDAPMRYLPDDAFESITTHQGNP
jgi:twinkle protein